MALTSYTGLKAAVARRMQRTDLTDDMDDFCALAEAGMNSRLRVNPMVVRYTAALGDEYSEAPDDFLGAKVFALNDNPQTKLRLLTADQIEVAAMGNETGKPLYYAVVGAEFRLYPIPETDWSAQLTYWQKIPSLVSADTNWVLESYPDAYLYGMLAQACIAVRNVEMAETWNALFGDAMTRIEEASMKAALGGVLTPAANGSVA